MQRVCFCKTVSLFNHILQPSQALALFYQSLLFSLKNYSLIKWICTYIDIPIGLQLLMIDINGNVTIDNELFYKQLANIKCNNEETKDTISIVNWLSRIVLRLATDYSISSKIDRSYEFETFSEFLKQFHGSFTSEDDDELNEEDLNRHAIHQALIKCIDYITTNTSDNLNSNSIDIQNFESNSIALYNQEIIQILCSDTLELENELTRDSLKKSPLENSPQITTNDYRFVNYYSIWADLWKNVTVEYLQFNNKKSLRKISRDNYKNDNDFCLHDRLMFEIKQKQRLRPINKSSHQNSHRKRIRPIKKLIESDSSSDDECIRKRVPVSNSLLESSSSSSEEDDTITCTKKQIYSTVKNLELEHISMENLLRLMKESSDALSLTFDEFCHIRNVITRAELETLLFDEKLYTEVAQSKLCFTCRKVHFNLLTFTFGIQCYVCKQKICRNCVTHIALPKDRLNDLPIQSFTPITKSLFNSDKFHSLDTQSPLTPTMNDILTDCESRRCSTPGNSNNQSNSIKWKTEPIDICTDCFFLLQQIRKKTRQRHVSPAPTSNIPSSSSSSFNRSHHSSSSRSTSNYNLSQSSSTSSIAALLAHHHHQQKLQRSLIVKTTSIQENLKTTQSVQELSTKTNLLPMITTTTTNNNNNNNPTERVTLSRHHLFLKLQPTYDTKLNNNNNNIKTE